MILAILICAVGAPMWLLIMWVRGGLGGVRTTTSRILSQCCPNMGQSRRVRRRRASQTGVRVPGGSSTAAASPSLSAKAADEQVEDASEKVVKMALEETEGGKGYRAMVVHGTRHMTGEARTFAPMSTFKCAAEFRAPSAAR